MASLHSHGIKMGYLLVNTLELGSKEWYVLRCFAYHVLVLHCDICLSVDRSTTIQHIANNDTGKQYGIMIMPNAQLKATNAKSPNNA